MAQNTGFKKHYMVNSAAFIAKKFVYTKNSDRLCKKPLPLITEKEKDLTLMERKIYFFSKEFI